VSPLTCPQCQRATFSFWQKQQLGPSGTLQCPACGARVEVPTGRAMACILGFVLIDALAVIAASLINQRLGYAGQWQGSLITAAALLLPGIPLIWAYYRFVPLQLASTP